MQPKKSKELFTVVLEYASGATKSVKVAATTREVAEHRAKKFNPTAKGVKLDV